jgi:predicted TIM-barrel fold metal-dependent hydrolase
MNDAGIERAVLISSAHTIGGPAGSQLSSAGEYRRVRQENDWAAAEVAKHPDRLVGFCSINPLRDWAVAEMIRCSTAPGILGIKMHFFTSQVDVLNPNHVDKLKRVVREANARGIPLLIHSLHRPGEFGRPHARVFLEQILPEVPDVPIQLAHLAVSYDNVEGADAALAVFAEAITAGDPRTHNLYFDTSAMPHPASTPEEIAAITGRLRQIGMNRILFGSDGVPDFPRASVAWADFKWRMPLTDDELRVIATNVAPYMRRRNLSADSLLSQKLLVALSEAPSS